MYALNSRALIFSLVLVLTFNFGFAQRKKKEMQPETKLNENPTLVVGIIVDQMRYDYLTRFWDQYGDGGFKRLVNQGFTGKNTHYNYAPTSTGPGHTSVYTGTTPSMHGIIGNEWYDKYTETSVYCASDTTYVTVGTTGGAGQMSPHRMAVTTLTDQLRLHTQMRGKTVAVALKDRGAVLPGGHTANAAYWFDSKSGHWITSSYYMDKLPTWVVDFNNADKVEAYKKPWNTLKPIAEYTASGTDINNYEGKIDGETHTGFPHDLPALWDDNGGFGLLRITPFGNSMTTDFALEAMQKEKLGADRDTDFLAVSYSSTDYVGHFFGVNSKEIEDTYLRLDLEIERLLNALDKQVGVNNYTLFLTADHAAVQVPSYLQDQKIPAGYIDMKAIHDHLDQFLQYRYGTIDIVKNMSNNQVFLDHKIIANLDMKLAEVENEIAKELLNFEEVYQVYTGHQMMQNEYNRGIPYILQNGYNQKRSGDVLFLQYPGFISYSKTGSTHGSPFIFDTHVPMLFYGKGIKKGSTSERREITDIAPTMATLLGIAYPNGTTGKTISEALAH